MAMYPKTTLTRYGGWLPVNRELHEKFLSEKAEKARSRMKQRESHIEAVAEFEGTIKADPEMIELFDQIFLQASPKNKITSFDQLLHALDTILPNPPSFYNAKDEQGNDIGEPVAVPIYLVFDLLSNTGAAYDLFRKPAFNFAMKNLLDSWGAFLKTEESGSTLTDKDDGWFTPAALAVLESEGRGDFESTYICPDSKAVNRGFKSWDEFFAREIQPEARPVPPVSGEIADTIINSACESTVYRIEYKVQSHDQFWLMSQKYSLYDMLDRDEEMMKKFIGGTVYQAFLSPADYHRWRAPVAGKIVRADIIPGTYYAVLPDAGAEVGDPDFKPGDPYGALLRSQAWLTQSATRAIIYIQSENPIIGLVGFIGVGMIEVSTCEITVPLGQDVKVGDELGMFHFGGSTHTILFGPQATITFADHVVVDEHIKVNSIIAQASQAKV